MLKLLRRSVVVFASLVAIPLSAATNNPPALLSIDPQTVIAGTGGFTLTATGANFLSGAVINFNGSPRTTKFVSSTQLTATIQSSDVLNAGNAQVTAANPGTLPSSPLTLTILPNSPSITSLTPNTLPVNSTTLDITITGQNFASTAVAQVNGASRTTAYVDSSHLTMTLRAADVTTAATFAVTVLNPNNKLSNSVTLTVTPQVAKPTITLLNPNSVGAGGPAFTLTVVGTNFVSASSVRLNGTPRTTTFVDSSHLTIQITTTDIANPTTYSVTVVNPDGTASDPATLSVTAVAAPVINSISPTTVTVGASPFTLTISGTNFVSGTTVQVGNSAPRLATFVNAGTLTVTIQTSDVTKAGQVSISVTTPQPKQATSNSVVLYVVAQNAPSITSITPQSIQAGQPGFNLLVNGSNFLIDDIVQVNGNSRTTQYLSATQLTAVVPASDIAVPTTLNVTVARKDGSGTSAPLQLTVTSTVGPSIAGFNPAQANVGDAPFTLAVLGHNFVNGSTVTFDTTARTTTYVSATELDINLAASDLSAARGVPVQVTNPDGTTSPIVLFYVVNAVPAISSLSPSSVISGDAGFQLTVTGTNFSSDSAVNVNGVPLATQLSSPTTLVANIDSGAISAPGSLNVTVTRNNVTSASVVLPVLKPTITAVSPQAIVLGTSSATLSVQGTAFLPTSSIVFLGSSQQTTVDPHGFLVATVDLTGLTPGFYAVSVRNSPNSLSDPFLIELQAPGTPRIDALQPSTIAAGSGITSIQLTGANFVPLSVVNVNGSARATTYVAGNLLNATLLTSDIAAAGTLHVTVVNPDGSTSAESLITVTGPTVPPSKRRAAKH